MSFLTREPNHLNASPHLEGNGRQPRIGGENLALRWEQDFRGQASTPEIQRPERTSATLTAGGPQRHFSARGGGGERHRSQGPLGTFARRAISLPVAVLATAYQLPARIIVSALKEAGGYVKFPWGAAVTLLGSAQSEPAKFAANAAGWLLLIPTLAVTLFTGGGSAIVNGFRHPIKTIGGLVVGARKGVAGFFSDKATEIQSILNGEGPSYYNLAAQYYTGDH